MDIARPTSHPAVMGAGMLGALVVGMLTSRVGTVAPVAARTEWPYAFIGLVLIGCALAPTLVPRAAPVGPLVGSIGFAVGAAISRLVLLGRGADPAGSSDAWHLVGLGVAGSILVRQSVAQATVNQVYDPAGPLDNQWIWPLVGVLVLGGLAVAVYLRQPPPDPVR